LHKCLALILGAGDAVALRFIDLVGETVVFDHLGVVDGNVGHAPVEVVDRVAAFAHYLGHKPVRVA
jgi:hypothetical protein